jgi:DNA-binding HxlR family transcriptional regulator
MSKNSEKIDLKDTKYCPVIRPTKVVGDVWTILIVKTLLKGPKRFNQIKDEIEEITSRTLSARLKFLVEQRIIIRKQYPQIPPRVEYELTDMGKGLEQIVVEIEKFGNTWMC